MHSDYLLLVVFLGIAVVFPLVPLAMAWAHLRTLRLADGPDEVHKRAIARQELKNYRTETTR